MSDHYRISGLKIIIIKMVTILPIVRVTHNVVSTLLVV